MPLYLLAGILLVSSGCSLASHGCSNASCTVSRRLHTITSTHARHQHCSRHFNSFRGL